MQRENVRGKYGQTYHNNRRNHRQCRDLELLYGFQHANKIKLLHYVNWDPLFGSTCYHDRLGHRMVHREETQPFPAPH